MGSIIPSLAKSGHAVIAEFPPMESQGGKEDVGFIEEYNNRAKSTDRIKNFVILGDGHSDKDARTNVRNTVHMILLCGAQNIKILGKVSNGEENFIGYAITFNIMDAETFFTHLASFNKDRDVAAAVHAFLEKLESSYDVVDKLEESFEACDFMGLQRDVRPLDVVITHCSNPRS